MTEVRDIRVVPLDETLAMQARATGLAPGYGHPVWNDTVEGTAPCRVCLTMIGDERMVLFTHDAFHGQEDLPLPGPVFVHERDCEPYAGSGGFPPEFRRLPLVLDAYRDGRELVAERRVEGTGADPVLRDLLADADYVHVRSAGAGCYLFTVRAA